MANYMKIALCMLFLMLITGCTNDGASPCVPAQLKISLSISAEGTIDTRGADQYIAIAEKLLLDTEPNATEWEALFSTPYFDLLINQNNISTAAKEKDDMRIAYMPSRSSQLQANAGRLAQHLNYKEHLATLKNYLAYIKTSAVVDSTKSLVYPFLPAGLRNPSLFPAMVYTYYYAQEANGIPTGILQDLTLVALVDQYRLGIVSAHEAYHAITTKAYESKLNPQIKCSDFRTQLLEKVINPISQEGIADLIDKDILLNPESPVRDILLSNLENEQNLSLAMITKLDEELKFAKETGRLKTSLDNINDTLIKNAGHMPGRVMAKAIQQYGKLNALIPVIENPFNFFYSYNDAAKASGGTLPVFSVASIDYLKQLETFLLVP